MTFKGVVTWSQQSVLQHAQSCSRSLNKYTVDLIYIFLHFVWASVTLNSSSFHSGHVLDQPSVPETVCVSPPVNTGRIDETLHAPNQPHDKSLSYQSLWVKTAFTGEKRPTSQWQSYLWWRETHCFYWNFGIFTCGDEKHSNILMVHLLSVFDLK